MENCKREYKGNSILDFIDNYVVVDIETTGFSPNVNEIIEIGAIKVENNEISETYHSLIKINELLPENIINLTGITDEMLRNEGISIESAITEFNKFIGQNIIVGHNVNFDINFLYDNYVKYTGNYISNDYLDTFKIAKMLVKDTYNHKLGTLAKKFDITYDTKHRALEDVYVTNEIYKKLRYLKEHYIEIRMKELEPYLQKEDSLFNKKVSIKSKLKYLDDTIVEAILERFNSKTFSFLSKNADILLVNDNIFKKLQEPLNEDDPYMLFFNEWMFKAQKRMNENDLLIISETDFCNRLGIPMSVELEKELDTSNPLYGKVCVFTGVLERMSRTQAETIVSSIGGIVGSGVTKKTSYLILGNNDYNSAVKNGKSSKHRKAEELQLQGSDIEIIPEDIFYQLIGED